MVPRKFSNSLLDLDVRESVNKWYQSVWCLLGPLCPGISKFRLQYRIFMPPSPRRTVCQKQHRRYEDTQVNFHRKHLHQSALSQPGSSTALNSGLPSHCHQKAGICWMAHISIWTGGYKFVILPNSHLESEQAPKGPVAC